jgi:hypothetical protein
MSALALATTLPSPCEQAQEFSVQDLRIFTSIPDRHHEIVALRGAVIVYDTDSKGREGFVEEGGLYVIEHQYTPAGMPYDSWLRHELEDSIRRAQPWSKLKTSREVIRLERHPKMTDKWGYRLASGFWDGPLHEWAICFPMVGKVVGIYRPN